MRTGAGRAPRIPLAILGPTLLAVSCASFVVELDGPVDARAERRPHDCETRHGEVLVGLALSGGGSRASLFAAGGIRALARLHVPGDSCSVLELVSHVSGVSGGSIAAAYLGAKKPGRDTPVLAADGRLHPEYETFFADFSETMRTDLWKRVAWRQFMKLRWLNPSKRAKSLAEVLDGLFLEEMTLAELGRREAHGDVPILLINSTWYNTGRRFVFTSLPKTAFAYDLGSELLDSSTPDHLGVATGGLHVSTAVAASSSVPWMIGPVTFSIAGDAEGSRAYWHAGDGGLFDNQGIETLMQALLQKLADGEPHGPRRALILLLDGSQPFSSGENELFAARNKKYIQPVRVMSIMEERAKAYQSLLWGEGGPGADDRVKVIPLRYHEAGLTPAALPESCRSARLDLATPEQIRRHLIEIPTHLKLRSDCDRDLILLAADAIVRRHAERILRFVSG